MDTGISFSEVLGRRARQGQWEDLKVSTYRRLRQALDEGEPEAVTELADYFIEEARVCFSLYRQWVQDLRAFLLAKGVSEGELADAEASILELLRLPDGTPWDPHRVWDDVQVRRRDLIAAAHRGDTETSLASLEHMKEDWRRCHDRDVDHTYGLMSEVQDRFGAEGIAEMYERLLLPLFAWRYQKFDIDQYPWDQGLETLLVVACEAMRGHLVGPERTGDFELIETEDRFVLRFDPCGSGGRTVRGDWVEGTPARMEPPYEWGVAKEPASWNHYTPGVCLYCAHCIVLMEEMPIDRFGYPVRVIDPPVYPDTDPDPDVRQRCQWTMFKDPTQTPEEVYRRVGRIKPAAFGSAQFDTADLPDASSLGLPGAG